MARAKATGVPDEIRSLCSRIFADLSGVHPVGRLETDTMSENRMTTMAGEFAWAVQRAGAITPVPGEVDP